jgi:hypothetical protein
MVENGQKKLWQPGNKTFYEMGFQLSKSRMKEKYKLCFDFQCFGEFFSQK